MARSSEIRNGSGRPLCLPLIDARATVLGLGGGAARGPEHLEHRPGDRIADRYELVAPIGSGAASEVWAAKHVLLNARYAIKLVRSSVLGTSAVRGVTERFLFEAQLSARLAAETDEIVRVHDAGMAAQGPYVVMDLVEGPSLDEVLERHGHLDPSRALDILNPIARALDLIHRRGVVHRDVKPGNILLHVRPDGFEAIRLADFGIAKAIGASLPLASPAATEPGFVLGTPDYMSPEQITGKPVTADADRWSLAVVAYELLTGMTPWEPQPSFVHTLRAITLGASVPVSQRAAALPTTLDDFFAQAFDPVPARRFRSATGMMDALRAALAPSVRSWSNAPPATPTTVQRASLEPVISPSGQAASLGRPAHRRRGAIGVAIGLAFLTGVSGASLLSQNQWWGGRGRSGVGAQALQNTNEPSAAGPSDLVTTGTAAPPGDSPASATDSSHEMVTGSAPSAQSHGDRSVTPRRTQPPGPWRPAPAR